ncbi:hypothetical protein D9758_002415 [Tetrapyrgos nigripes]|uniref:Uncharacterized protein n=1 Tax=Tetrapyrgos nigripes TaxID=182062 RepID=A0A8H5LTB9_9AGAR|nr:hypothetical protein D9758_002415 [Tetrapyrgos nigripes]
MSSSGPRIVDDLIPLILESSEDWWRRDLLRLATVSFAWLRNVQKRLYATPVLYSSRSCSLLARTLSENSYLCSLIKGIELCPISGGAFFTPEEMQGVRYLLGLEGLEVLTLGGMLSVATERFLNSISYPESILKLRINGSSNKDSLSCPASLEWDDMLASRFSGLQTLELYNLDLDIIYPSSPCRLQVSELVLGNVQLVGGDLSHLVQDADALKTLVVSGELSDELDEQVGFLVQTYGVESLRYEVECVGPWRPTLFDEGVSLPSTLRVLHLNEVRVDMETLSGVQRCYPEIEELMLTGRSVSLSRDDWVEIVKSCRFGKLRWLGLPGGTNGPPFRRWTEGVGETMETTCSERGIVLYSSSI